MKYTTIILIFIALIIAGFLLYWLVGNPLQNNTATTAPQEQNTQSTPIESGSKQTNSEGAVTVAVTPKTLVSGSEAQFEVVFDTHAVELNYDVAKIARLTDDSGTVYESISWTGGKGGHHLEGLLTFPALAKTAKNITLTIPGVERQDRVFRWNVE